MTSHFCAVLSRSVRKKKLVYDFFSKSVKSLRYAVGRQNKKKVDSLFFFPNGAFLFASVDLLC